MQAEVFESEDSTRTRTAKQNKTQILIKNNRGSRWPTTQSIGLAFQTANCDCLEAATKPSDSPFEGKREIQRCQPPTSLGLFQLLWLFRLLWLFWLLLRVFQSHAARNFAGEKSIVKPTILKYDVSRHQTVYALYFCSKNHRLV